MDRQDETKPDRPMDPRDGSVSDEQLVFGRPNPPQLLAVCVRSISGLVWINDMHRVMQHLRKQNLPLFKHMEDQNQKNINVFYSEPLGPVLCPQNR